MIIKCKCCNGTGHKFDDEGRVISQWGCHECDGYETIEVEDEE